MKKMKSLLLLSWLRPLLLLLALPTKGLRLGIKRTAILRRHVMHTTSSESGDDRSLVFRDATEEDFGAVLAVINEAARAAYKGSVIPEIDWQEPYMPEAELRCDIDEAGIRFTLGCAPGEGGGDEEEMVVAVMGVQPRSASPEKKQQQQQRQRQQQQRGLPDVTLVRHAYVRPAWQRRGVGTRVLRHLLEKREGEGEGDSTVRRPVLVGTWASNHEAIAFYGKQGFRLVDDTAEKDALLRTYWFAGGELGESNDADSEHRRKQIAASVVLADEAWFAAANASSTEEAVAVAPGGSGESSSSSPPLVMHTFELPRSTEPWTYEDAVKGAVCEGGRLRLVRWHISGPGDAEGTVAVEAVTYDADFRQRLN
jgi:GNAT superfamily N-acetyltransferase